MITIKEFIKVCEYELDLRELEIEYILAIGRSGVVLKKEIGNHLKELMLETQTTVGTTFYDKN